MEEDAENWMPVSEGHVVNGSGFLSGHLYNQCCIVTYSVVLWEKMSSDPKGKHGADRVLSSFHGLKIYSERRY